MTVSDRWIIKTAYYDQSLTEFSDWMDWQANAVNLTDAALQEMGGRPYYSGTDWSMNFCVAFWDEDGLEEGLTLTGATVNLTVYDASGTEQLNKNLTVNVDQTSRQAGTPGQRGEAQLDLIPTDVPEAGDHNLWIRVTDAGGKIINVAVGQFTVRTKPT